MSSGRMSASAVADVRDALAAVTLAECHELAARAAGRPRPHLTTGQALGGRDRVRTERARARRSRPPAGRSGVPCPREQAQGRTSLPGLALGDPGSPPRQPGPGARDRRSLVQRLGGRGEATGTLARRRLLGCRHALDRRAVRGQEAAAELRPRLEPARRDRTTASLRRGPATERGSPASRFGSPSSPPS